jgi:hypothetical protein
VVITHSDFVYDNAGELFDPLSPVQAPRSLQTGRAPLGCVDNPTTARTMAIVINEASVRGGSLQWWRRVA